ncbi:hypothetical protein [Cohnella sp.]|uniref:hypothetical protein n=1 Tax=Cohnella sp. TaxID=1883426 RepID=UPI00356A86D1
MSMFTLQNKNRLKSYVAEVLVSIHNFDASSVNQIVEQSAFSKTLETDPEFVFHYDVEYWAEKVKNERQKSRKLALA